MQPYSFHLPYGLGDIVVFSAFIRDLELAYPKRFRVSVTGSFPSYWRNFDHVKPVDPGNLGPVIDCNYDPGIVQSKAGVKKHFLNFFYDLFERKTGIKVPMTLPHGDIRLGNKVDSIAQGRYWIIVPGGKLDLTNKWWSAKRYQEVVDRLAEQGIRCLQAGANHQNNFHPVLTNVVQALDTTNDIADMFRLVRGAEGVICGVTSFMHVAAVFNKPCVVVAGGREEWWWEAYSNNGQFPNCPTPVKIPHRFLHTLGQLGCCQTSGCWRRRVVAIRNSDLFGADAASRLCLDVVRPEGTPLPKCMDLIKTEHVVDAVLSYYQDGTLPPLSLRGEPVQPPVLTVIPPVVSPPAPPAEKTIARETGVYAALNHPLIGGKFTTFVLCYGDHPELAKSCISSILDSMPADRLDLRVGLNGVSQATKDVIKGLGPNVISKVYTHDENAKKYPLMREMFYDPRHPIRTEYLVWFDDDTRVVNAAWAIYLAEKIIQAHSNGSRLYGTRLFHDLRAVPGKHPERWFYAAPWWRNEPLRLRDTSMMAPNGSCIDFAVGYFWALHTQTMKNAQIPDPRLNHNGGDITIGAQVIQAGYKICEFNTAKSLVWCPTKDKGGRRGFSEPFPWMVQT